VIDSSLSPATPEAEHLARFRNDVEMVFTGCPLNRTLNTDEPRWKLVNTRMVTVGDRGAEGVYREFDGDVKACLTVMASIDGSKLPVWISCRGKTPRCEANSRRRFASEVGRWILVLTHQENSWTDRMVALAFPCWISE
jgi:hypothetical protein